MTRLVPMIGHPVAQTKLPDSFNRRARDTGLDLVMERIDVPPPELASFVAAVRASEDHAGFVSTIPHKASLPGMLDSWSPTVTLTGTCNTARRDGPEQLHGDMLDGVGMIDALESAGANLHGAEISLVGCGAAGTAIAHELVRRGVSRIELTDRRAGRAREVIERLRGLGSSVQLETREPGDRTGTVLVNASPVGMHGEESPFTDSELDRALAAADAVTNQVTPFLSAAAERNLVTVDGSQMAAAQLAPLLRLLSERPPASPRNP